MKTNLWIYTLSCLILLISCGKKNKWEVELKEKSTPLEITDLSQKFFDTKIPLAQLQQQYPFFFDNNGDEIWEAQRVDPYETSIYDSIQKIYKNQPYKESLEELFAYYKHHFPNAQIPKVYVYSSGMQNIYTPVLYGAKENMLFIALDGFLGTKNNLYLQEKVFPYLAQNMNPENLPTAVVQAIGNEIVPFDPRKQAFIDLMILEGKKLVLADALLPKTEDYLKIGYSKEKYDWSQNNEGNIWNYFVEQNLIFSTDKSIRERFLTVAPFSKFLNEIETDSPGRIGAWIGWQICKAYLDKNSEVTLQEFLMKDTEEIFKESKYKPSKGNGNYTPLENKSKDETKNYE